MAIDHDGLYKAVISEFFMDFLRLFYPGLADQIDPASIKEKEQEIITDLLSGQKLRVDLLREVKLKGQSRLVLILVEPQSYNDDEFEERLFRYFVELYYKYKLKVLPIAVLTYPSPKTLAPPIYHPELDEETGLYFKHRAVQLNRLRWQDFTSRGNPVAAAFMAQMQVRKKQKVQAKVAALSQMAELPLNEAQLHLLSGFVDTYLRLDQVEQTKFEKELDKLGQDKKEKTMNIVTSWMEQGLERGLEQGLEQGEKRGAYNVVQKLLSRRFGPLSAQEEADLKELNAEQLERLGEAFLDFQDKADLLVWLNAQTATQTAG